MGAVVMRLQNRYTTSICIAWPKVVESFGIVRVSTHETIGFQIENISHSWN